MCAVIRDVMIDTARRDDLAPLHALIEGAYRGAGARRGWTHEADMVDGQRTTIDVLTAELDNPAQRILVARDGAAIIGCVALTDQGNGSCYLGMLSVDPGLQAGGLGRRLVEAAEQAARDVFDARRIEMTVVAQRDTLIAWYERRGYRRTGEERPFPYGDARFGTPRRDDLFFIVLARDFA